MGSISLNKAEYLALFLETFVFGTFFTLCIITIMIVLQSKNSRTPKFLLPVAVLMMVLAIGHLVIDFIRGWNAFVIAGTQSIGGAEVYFDNISNPLFLAKNILYWFQTMLGDGVIMWRCYMVYGQKVWSVVAPVIMYVVHFAVGCYTMNQIAHAPPAAPIFDTRINWGLTVYFVLTMVITAYCTTLITIRIWSTSNASQSVSSLRPVIIAMVESGALYTSSILCVLVTYLASSYGTYTSLDIVMPFVGIVYCLIFLQIKRQIGIGSSNMMDSGNGSNGADAMRAPIQVWTSSSVRQDRDALPMKTFGSQDGASDDTKYSGPTIV